MKIEHIAIWVLDLEAMRNFYTKYFNMACNDKYANPKKGFESYFLSFKEGSARIELMRSTAITQHGGIHNTFAGLTHFAISVSSKEMVDNITETLRADGYTIAGEPRTTGDGYYESVILDPKGNHIEITV